MKLDQLSLFSAAAVLGGSSAFVPPSPNTFSVHRQRPFLPTVREMAKDEPSIDEEVEELVQAELSKTKKFSNLRNEKGVEYAPWMKISPEEEEKIRTLMREKTEARRRRQEQEQTVRGALLQDSQAQELSGTGLRYKIVDNDSVELEWATSSEAATKGFIIKRRAARDQDFAILASYQTYGPLASQGPDGGVYRYYDENVPTGGWVYRITECEASGAENDLSQCLVEIQTPEEQRGAVIAAAAIGLVGVAAVAAGILLDPVQY